MIRMDYNVWEPSVYCRGVRRASYSGSRVGRPPLQSMFLPLRYSETGSTYFICPSQLPSPNRRLRYTCLHMAASLCVRELGDESEKSAGTPLQMTFTRRSRTTAIMPEAPQSCVHLQVRALAPVAEAAHATGRPGRISSFMSVNRDALAEQRYSS